MLHIVPVRVESSTRLMIGTYNEDVAYVAAEKTGVMEKIKELAADRKKWRGLWKEIT